MSLLKALFGPSREDIWRQLSQQLGGSYIKSEWWQIQSDKVEARHKEWVITLDQYDPSGDGIRYTRIRAPYINKDGFRFTIYRESFFSKIGKKLGMQDVEVGHPTFDDEFIIKGNDEHKLWKLFSNRKIRNLIHQQPNIHLSIVSPANSKWFKKKFGTDVDELQFKVSGIIKDLDQLHSLYELFAETLNQLCHIGAAYEEDPLL